MFRTSSSCKRVGFLMGKKRGLGDGLIRYHRCFSNDSNEKRKGFAVPEIPDTFRIPNHLIPLDDHGNQQQVEQKSKKEELWVWHLPNTKVPTKPNRKFVEEVSALFTQKTDYLGLANRASHMETLNPTSGEVCFIGKSNVGKSSLVNTLLGVKGKQVRKNGALVSRKPGRTASLHAFAVGRDDTRAHRRSLCQFRTVVVDLPGYGYSAFGGKKGAERLSKIIASYLTERSLKQLACAYLLIDARAGIKENDSNMIGMLEACGVPYTVVLTKCDAVGQEDLSQKADDVIYTLSDATIQFANPVIFGTTTRSYSRRWNKHFQGSTAKTASIRRLRADVIQKSDNLVKPRMKNIFRRSRFDE